MSAMRVFSNFKSVTLFSAVISVLCTLIGMAASIVLGTPVGATIVCFDVLAFLICWITGKLTGRS
ncbi:MAG: metal ABC transporter permease, partial [Clostridia bacterium]|nr:metal ABC transporter permease [Clostridia bacterium]